MSVTGLPPLYVESVWQFAGKGNCNLHLGQYWLQVCHLYMWRVFGYYRQEKKMRSASGLDMSAVLAVVDRTSSSSFPPHVMVVELHCLHRAAALEPRTYWITTPTMYTHSLKSQTYWNNTRHVCPQPSNLKFVGATTHTTVPTALKLILPQTNFNSNSQHVPTALNIQVN